MSFSDRSCLKDYLWIPTLLLGCLVIPADTVRPEMTALHFRSDLNSGHDVITAHPRFRLEWPSARTEPQTSDLLSQDSIMSRLERDASRRPLKATPTGSSAITKNCKSTKESCTDQEVVATATSFLHNLTTPSVPVSSQLLPSVAHEVNNILRLGQDLSHSAVLQDLDFILTKMVLEDNRDVVHQVQSEVAMMVVNVRRENPVVGFTFSSVDGNLTPNSLKHIRLNETGQKFPPHTEVAVTLPLSILERNSRMLFVVFSNDRAFTQDSSLRANKNLAVNSRVLNINLSNGRSVLETLSEGQFVDVMFKPFINRTGRKRCAFWDLDSGNWSSSGAELLRTSVDSLDVCRYRHMTHFAQLIVSGSAHQRALDIISLVGCALSLLGILGIAVTAAMFQTWRKQVGNKILLNLSAAIALNIVTFLVIATARLDTGSASCVVVGTILHFSVLASFCWMLVSAVLQFLRLVVVLGTRIPHLLIKACAFAWGFPLVPVVILLAINPQLYKGGPDKTFCFPEGVSYYVAVMAPVIIIVVTNTIVFVTILCQIYPCFNKGVNIQKHSSNKAITMRRLMTTVLLFFLFGLTWIFGLFARITVFAYLFCITATMQGFVLFIFFVVVERKSRDYWTNTTSRVTSSERNSGSKTSSQQAESVLLRQGESFYQRPFNDVA